MRARRAPVCVKEDKVKYSAYKRYAGTQKRRELHKGQQKCDLCVSVTIKDEKHRVVRVKRAFRELIN